MLTYRLNKLSLPSFFTSVVYISVLPEENDSLIMYVPTCCFIKCVCFEQPGRKTHLLREAKIMW